MQTKVGYKRSHDADEVLSYDIVHDMLNADIELMHSTLQS